MASGHGTEQLSRCPLCFEHSGLTFAAMGNVTEKVVFPLDKPLPPERERVIVVCKSFRCLGYVDKDGVWRDEVESKELKDVFGWMRFGKDI